MYTPQSVKELDEVINFIYSQKMVLGEKKEALSLEALDLKLSNIKEGYTENSLPKFSIVALQENSSKII